MYTFTCIAESSYPTLAEMPHQLYNLINVTFKPSTRVRDQFYEDFKASLKSALSNRFQSVFTTPNLALRAACMHPKYGHLSYIDKEYHHQVLEAVIEDACELLCVNSLTTKQVFLSFLC